MLKFAPTKINKKKFVMQRFLTIGITPWLVDEKRKENFFFTKKFRFNKPKHLEKNKHKKKEKMSVILFSSQQKLLQQQQNEIKVKQHQWSTPWRQCTSHAEHCFLCGKGIYIVCGRLAGDLVYTKQDKNDEEEEQLDHIRCYECSHVCKDIPKCSAKWFVDKNILQRLETIKLNQQQKQQSHNACVF